MRYLVIVEKTNTGFSAYSPDLPGCVATGDTPKAVETQMRGAVEFHLDGMREDGELVPEPSSYATYVLAPA